MDSLHGMFAVDQSATLQFFIESIKEVTPVQTARERTRELYYVSSIMAHNALTSRDSVHQTLVPASLGEYLNLFVLDRNVVCEPETMELAGAQGLFLAGFYGFQNAQRHNVKWCIALSSDFFARAAKRSRDAHKSALLAQMSLSNSHWAWILGRLNKLFRENQSDPRIIRFS